MTLELRGKLVLLEARCGLYMHVIHGAGLFSLYLHIFIHYGRDRYTQAPGYDFGLIACFNTEHAVMRIVIHLIKLPMYRATERSIPLSCCLWFPSHIRSTSHAPRQPLSTQYVPSLRVPQRHLPRDFAPLATSACSRRSPWAGSCPRPAQP